ncbi:MAG: glycoside hydrolase family 3 protein [Spirochaetes bacterium]|nr:glycoside hydrolase family 3 protein [Spirochaetota bacterium]
MKSATMPPIMIRLSRPAPRALAAVFCLAVLVACGRKPSPAPAGVPAIRAGDPADLYREAVAKLVPDARAVVARLSVFGLCAQVLMVGIGGSGSIPPATRDFLSRVPAGAVILFAFNVPKDPLALAAALGELQDLAKVSGAGIPPFVALDHEGGGVFRFSGGVTKLPSPRSVGELDDPASPADEGADAAYAFGGIAASELRALGVTLNLAPVAEAGGSAFLGVRAYSDDPGRSGKIAARFVEALQSGGVAAAAKHYPGNAPGDPHAGLVTLDAGLDALARRYDPPFADTIGAGVAFVLLSHVIVPAIDAEAPVSLSRAAVTGRLKGSLGFPGVVLTDSVTMKALSSRMSPGEAAVRALLAGADMVMVSGQAVASEAHAALVEAVGSGRLSRERLEDAAVRIVVQKLRFALQDETDPVKRSARLEGFAALVKANGEKAVSLTVNRDRRSVPKP